MIEVDCRRACNRSDGEKRVTNERTLSAEGERVEMWLCIPLIHAYIKHSQK